MRAAIPTIITPTRKMTIPRLRLLLVAIFSKGGSGVFKLPAGRGVLVAGAIVGVLVGVRDGSGVRESTPVTVGVKVKVAVEVGVGVLVGVDVRLGVGLGVAA